MSPSKVSQRIVLMRTLAGYCRNHLVRIRGAYHRWMGSHPGMLDTSL